MPRLQKKRSMRHWHALTVLALFFVCLVAAVFYWLTVTIRDQRKQKAAADAIEAAGGMAHAEQTWLGKLLRDDSLVMVGSVALEDGSVTEDAVARLEDTDQVVALTLEGPRVTDDMLAHLERMNQLMILSLDKTGISDDGLAHLRGLSQLRFLRMNDTGITDAGLAHLAGLDIRMLQLGGTKVTTRGVKRLKRALPRCHISLEPKVTSPISLPHSGPVVRQLYPPPSKPCPGPGVP